MKSIDHENKRIQLESVDRPEMVKGDVNGDGIADVSDIVLFQKWLLGDPDAVLSNWKAADLYADGQMDETDAGQTGTDGHHPCPAHPEL